MQKFNNIIFTLALHGKGYRNCCDFGLTGEKYFFKKLAQFNPKLCIDIGANVGTYSEQLLSSTNTSVISFEPLPKAYEILNCLLLKFPNRLRVFNAGVGNCNEVMELKFGDHTSELASFSGNQKLIKFLDNENNQSIMVQVNTLDYFIKTLEISEEIDLIKIDTEGFEYEVLLGAGETIRKNKPKFIQIEYNWHQLYNNQTLLSFQILLNDYQLFQMLPYGLIKRDAHRPESNIYFYSNFLFVRNEIANLI
jgi:FkbM family methyltransferase